MTKKIYRSLWVVFVCLLLTATFSAHAQKQVVSGTITDKTNNPLPGVNILLRGTAIGTTTDANGVFSLEAKSDDVLVVSFIGYKTKEVTVGNQSQISVSLEDDISTLSEVVVVGYGEQKKKLVTGANVNVDGEAVKKQNYLNPLQSLQGQAAGVMITSTSGQPGSDMKVVVRGLGTIGNSGPLYVIDGIPGGDISIINPADIKSIDVLKDAASAAIYGSQAANGVILVTTKMGSKGKSQITFDGFSGIQNVSRKVDMLNAEEYKTIMNEQALNSGSAPIDFSSMKGLGDTNWMNKMFKKDAKISNYSFDVSGGSDNSSYAVSFNYINQEGIVGGKGVSDYERYGFRTNSEHKLLNNKLKFGQQINFNSIQNTGINVGDQYNNSLRGAFITSPLAPIYSDNNLYGSPFNDTQNSDWFKGDGNPYGVMMTAINNKNDAQKVLADIYAELEVIKGLKIKSLVGYNYYATAYHQFTPLYQFSIYSYNKDHTTTNQSTTKGQTLTWFNTATYDFTLAEKHAFSVMVGTEAINFQGTKLSGSNWNLLSQFNDFSHAYLSNTTGQAHLDDKGNVVETRVVGGGPENQYKRASTFGRLSYNFDEKYLFNATIRRDGSSRFANGHQWGVFPSVSAGWVLNSENFFQSSGISNFLNFFKLRASWGRVGSQDIDDFQYAAPIGTSTNVTSTDPAAYYTFGTTNTNIAGAYASRLSNPNVKWETSEQTDFGFDSKLLDNHLNVNFDYYIKTTKDWLVTAPILATAGANAPVINGGSVKNSGVELALAYDNSIGGVHYRIGANGAYNKNVVGKIPTQDGIIHGKTGMLYDNSEEFYRAQDGNQIGYFWGYKTAGIFQNTADIQAWKEAGNGILQPDVKPGDVKYVDAHKDGKIDSNDKVNLGVGIPKMTFGFNIALDYKGFDLSINAYGMSGNKIVQSYRNQTNKQANYTSAILNRWTGDGTSKHTPRVTETNINWQFSDLYIHDGSFLRISNVTFGYDLAKLFKNSVMSQMRVYVQGQNLLTFTKYDGMDPEIGYGTDKWVSGVDLGYYPRPRTLMAGVSLKF